MKPSLFNTGDTVRYVINKSSFSKGTLPKWSKTIHTIVSSEPHSYILENGTPKKYYELQRVTEAQKLDNPIAEPTMAEMRKENAIKRKLKKENVNITNITTDKRQIRQPLRLHY